MKKISIFIFTITTILLVPLFFCSAANPPLATTFTLTGPSSGNVNTASSNFTITPDGQYNGTITITPTGTGSTGLSPTVLTFNASSASQTFTITPTVAGSITLTPTNNESLTNPSTLTYTVVSLTLNFATLYTTTNSVIARINNNVEGTDVGNYEVGSIEQLRAVLDQKYNEAVNEFYDDAFTDQASVNSFNQDLNDAIVLFEARRVGVTKSSIDLSSNAGGLVPKCPDTGCGFDQLMQLINNVITFLLFTVATPLAALIVAYAGWLYLSSGGNPGNISKAKKILMNVVVGYIIGLAAWLIIKTIITSLGVDPSINTFLK